MSSCNRRERNGREIAHREMMRCYEFVSTPASCLKTASRLDVLEITEMVIETGLVEDTA